MLSRTAMHYGRLVTALSAALSASLSLGCTFYTACPPAGGSSNSGGGSTSTSGGSGGSGASAGGLVGGSGNVPGSWTSVTSNLVSVESECGNLSFLSAKPDEDLLIAGIAQAGLWGSTDGGGTWQVMGSGAASDKIINRTSTIVYDPDDRMRFWESGIYNGGGVYETLDDGNTFKQLGSVAHSDLVSVDLSDPDRKTLLSGGHEMAQTVNRSTDAGLTWGPIGTSLPGATNCTTPLVVDAQTYLVGCAGLGGGPTGVYGTTDGGGTWASLTTSGGSSPPLRASDGSIYWTSVGGGGMTRSTDNGVTWTDVVGPGVLKSLSPIELPDGRLAAVGNDAVVVSADNGATWKEITPPLPFKDPVGLAYSAQEKAIYVWHFTCGAPPVPVPDDAIMMFAFDYTSQ